MPKEFKSFYSKAGGEEGSRCNYPDRLDTYGCGCQHDCAYCYAKSLLDFRGLWNAEEPSVADLDKVLAQVEKLPKGSVIRLGGMTDCLMPLEGRQQVTYHAIDALNRRGVHQLIVTKSPLIASEPYMELLDPKLAHIQVSVTSTKPNEYEKAAPPKRRAEAARRLQDAGFDVQLRLSPYLEQNVDLSELSAWGVDRALVEFLRVNHWVEKWMPADYRDWKVKEGGYRHLTLKRKTQMLKPLREMFGEISVCEDVDGHYQFFRAFVNHNHDDCCNLRL